MIKKFLCDCRRALGSPTGLLACLTAAGALWLSWQTISDMGRWSLRNVFAYLLLRYGSTSVGPLLFFKVVVVIGTLLVLVASWQQRSPAFQLVLRGFNGLARRPALATILVSLLAVGGSVSLAYSQLPVPRGHDPFSYLLGADTFAHGRVTNPPHPLWVHFESFHIIQQPTYASKYPPAQSLVLAVGQVLGGHPVVGVWLGLAAACGALYWMLLAWVPPRWALLGALLATTRLVLGRGGPGDLIGYWGQAYGGGAVATVGGALVFGALPRLIRHLTARHALLLGLGLAVLANSRPFEGLVVSVPVVALILFWLVRRGGPPVSTALARVALPLALVLVPTAAAMGYYNYRVTGHALRMPYQVHEDTYHVVTEFLWKPLRPQPVYRHQALYDYHVRQHPQYYFRQRSSLLNLTKAWLVKTRRLTDFYLGGLLLIPLLAVPWALGDRWMRFALVTCALMVVALAQLYTVNPHYAAPAAAPLYVLVTQGLRQLRVWRWRDHQTGRRLVRTIAVLCLSTLMLSARPRLVEWPTAWVPLHYRFRPQFIDQLKREGSRHLVIVRYAPDHGPSDEWVYNEADIDAAPIVWAREMNPEQNRKLLAYFKDRRFWLLEADGRDGGPPRMLPYPTDWWQTQAPATTGHSPF